jgi:penicillin-binding protein 1A
MSDRRKQNQGGGRPRSGFGRVVSITGFVCWILAIPALIIAICMLYRVAQTYQGVKNNLSQVVNTELPKGSQATQMYARDYDAATGKGTLLAAYGEQNRQEAQYADIPALLLVCVLSTEDARFFDHNGVDVKGNLRALYKIVRRHGDIRGGGSTITQQLSRNVYLPQIKSEKTINRKIQEIILASELEQRFGKDAIIEAYLNHIFFGSAAYGIRAAAQTYFGKDLDELSLAECALLAGLPQSPTAYSPNSNPEKARERRDEVLRLLDTRLDTDFLPGLIQHEPEKFGKLEITHEQIQAALKSPVKLDRHYTGSEYYRAPYFCDSVRSMLNRKYHDNAELGEGLKVVTTIDPQYQAWAEEAVRNVVEKYRKAGKRVSEAAVIVMEARSGEVLADVGGIGWNTPITTGRHNGEPDQYNRAFFGARQVGSSFKSFTYATAYAQGFTFSTPVNDAPMADLSQQMGKSYPVDDDGRWFGWMSIASALQHSRNAAAVDCLRNLTGIDAVIDTARKMGIRAQLPAVPALTLGVANITPIEMAEAYNTFPNMGVHVGRSLIKQVYDQSGMLIESNDGAGAIQARSNRVFGENSAQPAYMMVRNMQLVVNAGTGTKARVKGVEIGGKTGTCDEFSDAWFIGYSPEIVCAVWVGNDDYNVKMRHVFGGDAPAEIFRQVMSKIYTPVAGKAAAPARKDKNGKPLADAAPAEPVPAYRPRYTKVKFEKPEGVEFNGFGSLSSGSARDPNKDKDAAKPGDQAGGTKPGGDAQGDSFHRPWTPPPPGEGAL